MKKLNFLSVIFLFAVGFSGCSSDDDDNGNIEVVSNNSILFTFEGNRFYIEFSDNIYENDAILTKPPKAANVIYEGYIQIPSSVSYNGRTLEIRTIGTDIFSSSSTVTAVNIPTTVKKIDFQAFAECINLTQVLFNYHIHPDGLDIGQEAFTGCVNLEKINLPENVNSLRENAFAGCTKLTEITLPDNIILYEGAFANCMSLKKATISPNTIMYEGVFESCINLTSVTLPKVIARLPNRTFKGCKKLTSVTIPENIDEIGIEAFSGSGITSIVLPEKVKYIGEYAFEDCQQLETIKLPQNLPVIGAYAFRYCINMSTINIPENCTLNDYAFYNSGITTLTIPGGVSIRSQVFAECRELTSVTFEKDYKVSYIVKDLFEGCRSLTSVTYECKPFLVSGMFKGCRSLTEFDFTGISFIERYAFEETGFEKLELPEGVSHIAESAFRYCNNLRTVIFPESLEAIYDYSFSGCAALGEIYSYGEAPRYSYIREGAYYPERVFSQHTLDNAILHRPASSEYDETYNEKPWCWFKNVAKDL